MDRHTCKECGKTFSRRDALKRHLDSVHTNQLGGLCDRCGIYVTLRAKLKQQHNCVHNKDKFSCGKCGKTFATNFNRVRHETKCVGHINHTCEQCHDTFSALGKLRDHIKKVHTPVSQHKTKTSSGPPAKEQRHEPGPRFIRCKTCHQQFGNRRDWYNHYMTQHGQVGNGNLQAQPFDVAPWELEGGRVDEGLKECYQINRSLILAQHDLGPVVSIYNVPVSPNMTVNDLNTALSEIYERQSHAYKVNLTFGMILKHVETGEYRYFRPFSNVSVFDEPEFIGRRSHLQRIANKLDDMDLTHQMAKVRPNSKWRLALLTNVRFQTYSTNFLLGVTSTPLPPHIKNSKAIISLDQEADNLCAFRCLSLHKKQPVSDLYHQWQEHVFKQYEKDIRGVSARLYKGLQLSELTIFEQCFQVNIQAYELMEDRTALHIFKSSDRYDNTMYVNHHNNHLSYIKDFSKYAKQYSCPLCDRVFHRLSHQKSHIKICDQKTKFRYPGGFYKETQTVFQQLEEFGINVPGPDRLFPHFAVYDFESVLEKLTDDSTAKVKWSHHHVPISVSVCSNIPGHTQPRCFVNTDLDALLQEMLASLANIQKTMESIANGKWGQYLDELKKQMNHLNDDDEEDRMEQKKMQAVFGKLKGYITSLPVLGFNSAKYDLNLIKRKLAKHLDMANQEHSFVVKKANAYACIATDKYKFLDISHFLAPGTSYSSFLKAYQVEEKKGYFPYEWFDTPAKLDHTALPPPEAFFSSLKGTNITEEDYAYCQRVWEEQNMQTFHDFLSWYNNLDVGPFVTAAERLQGFYFDKGIDVFRSAISVPGLARQMLFKSAKDQGAEFAIIDERNKDLDHTIKSNIVGGPSIIFTRYHKADETRLRGGNLCKRITGYDANALYLWAIGQNMPEGVFVRRQAANEFRPEFRDQYMQAFNWLNYLIRFEGKHIEHLRNHGREIRIGKYPVDGFDGAENVVYQFQGCYHHGHNCQITKKIRNMEWLEQRETKLEKTKKITAFIRSKGHTVVEMWECEFKQFCQSHPKIYDIIYQSRPAFTQSHRSKVTQKQILNGVRSGQLFGMVEVDISIPEHWDAEFQKDLSPTEYFSEMCPLFCNSEVTFDQIGEHMRAHAREEGLSEKPRRLLVSGTKACQILLSTPLLNWYLSHGMRVTKVYQVVEYRKMACFRSFVKEVSDARRKGDASPDMAIIADTMKLIGNSGYGSMIMDKTKHRNVRYAGDENSACYQVNDPLFRSMTCLDPEDGYYEIESAKSRISLDLPTQLAFFTLQYAKLRMVQYYFDFLDYFLDRGSYEYMEMDTDSAYMALAASSLSELVKPELKAEFDHGLTGLCHDEFNDSEGRWLPRTCCDKHAKFDKRVPGLFKTEYEGDQMIGLCSKTYIVSKSVPSKHASAVLTATRLTRRARGLKRKRLYRPPSNTVECKFSSKGVNKRHVENPLKTFRNVLRTHRPAMGMNRGFRARNNGIYTYLQQRKGFSYFYCKRRVLQDGIHTVPLDIILCPQKPAKETTPIGEEDPIMTDSQLVDMLAEWMEY